MNYSIYAESTPNPEVMKFVANRMLASKSLEIKTLKEATGISIAEELLKFPFIQKIYLSSNFISITKVPSVEWDGIAMQLRVFIADHLNNNGIKNYTENIKLEKHESAQNTHSKETDVKEYSQEEKDIESILTQYIKPAVEADGGSITLNYYKENIVCVDLKGACSGCPSSTTTLKLGIESLLRQKVNPKIEVISNEK